MEVLESVVMGEATSVVFTNFLCTPSWCLCYYYTFEQYTNTFECSLTYIEGISHMRSVHLGGYWRGIPCSLQLIARHVTTGGEVSCLLWDVLIPRRSANASITKQAISDGTWL